MPISKTTPFDIIINVQSVPAETPPLTLVECLATHDSILRPQHTQKCTKHLQLVGSVLIANARPIKRMHFHFSLCFGNQNWFTKWRNKILVKESDCDVVQKKNISMKVYWRGTPEIGLFCFSRIHLGIMFAHHDFTLSLSLSYMLIYVWLCVYINIYIHIYLALLSNH